MSFREIVRVLIAVINLSGKCLEIERFLPQYSVTTMKKAINIRWTKKMPFAEKIASLMEVHRERSHSEFRSEGAR